MLKPFTNGTDQFGSTFTSFGPISFRNNLITWFSSNWLLAIIKTKTTFRRYPTEYFACAFILLAIHRNKLVPQIPQRSLTPVLPTFILSNTKWFICFLSSYLNLSCEKKFKKWKISQVLQTYTFFIIINLVIVSIPHL